MLDSSKKTLRECPWWSVRESNPRPRQCECRALSAELTPLPLYYSTILIKAQGLDAGDGVSKGEGADLVTDFGDVFGIAIEMGFGLRTVGGFGGGFLTDEGDLFHPIGEVLHVLFAEATSSDSGGAEADARGAEGGGTVVGERVSIQGEADSIESLLVEFTVDAETGFDVDEDEMIIGAAALEGEAIVYEGIGEGFGILDDILSVSLKLGLQSFAESNGFSGNNML